MYWSFVSWSRVAKLKMKNCTLYTICAISLGGYIALTHCENWKLKIYVASFSHFHDVCTLKNVSVYVITETPNNRVSMCMLLHDTIQVQRCRLDNILCIGAGLTISCVLVTAWLYLVYWHSAWVNCATLSCHSIFYHDLHVAWLTIYNVWHNCQATSTSPIVQPALAIEENV